jgi:hypothetical protein
MLALQCKVHSCDTGTMLYFRLCLRSGNPCTWLGPGKSYCWLSGHFLNDMSALATLVSHDLASIALHVVFVPLCHLLTGMLLRPAKPATAQSNAAAAWRLLVWIPARYWHYVVVLAQW